MSTIRFSLPCDVSYLARPDTPDLWCTIKKIGADVGRYVKHLTYAYNKVQITKCNKWEMDYGR